MKPILEVHNLSKEFLIGANNEPYLALRDVLANPFKLLNQPKKEVFKALDNVSFDVMPGESIGIIGRNGAGKSTLLKILSKITPPSSGKIICRGRIAALLEVGTGFHPELTGRENIYMNGSILGMRKWEIDKHFDEIVNFSGVEKFLDTPLKRYSSGMQLRLAFAVAAHLEPEILIIDEVLAVGDAEFQKKCLGKMDEVTKSGRTVLFVSHNMTIIEQLCGESLFLENGKLKYYDKTPIIINKYLLKKTDIIGNSSIEFSTKSKNFISKLEIYCDGRCTDTCYMGCELEIIMHFESEEPLDFPLMGIVINDSYNSPVLFFNNKNYGGNLVESPLKKGIFKMKIPYLQLMSGIYSVDIYFSNINKNLDVKKNIFHIVVEPKHFLNSGEILSETYNKFFMNNIIWDIQTIN